MDLSNLQLLVTKFLEKNCCGEFNYIKKFELRHSVVYPLHNSSTLSPKLENVLYISCDFKNPNLDNEFLITIETKLKIILKSILGEVNNVIITNDGEFNYSC
jgi:hypothetical protein